MLWCDEKKINRFGSDGIVLVRRRSSELFHPECLQSIIKGCGGSIMAWACLSATETGLYNLTIHLHVYIKHLPFHITKKESVFLFYLCLAN